MSRQHWSPKRVVVVSLSIVVWLAAGLGAYLYVGSHRTAHGLAAKRPGQSNVQAKNSPLSRLPGTLYLVQDGTVYRLRRGVFTAVLNSPGGAAGWTQPACTPDGQSLVLVRGDYAYSDLYLIDPAGNVQEQLTHKANPTVQLNHWAFYPRPSSDGALFFSYDPKDRFNSLEQRLESSDQGKVRRDLLLPANRRGSLPSPTVERRHGPSDCQPNSGGPSAKGAAGRCDRPVHRRGGLL